MFEEYGHAQTMPSWQYFELPFFFSITILFPCRFNRTDNRAQWLQQKVNWCFKTTDLFVQDRYVVLRASQRCRIECTRDHRHLGLVFNILFCSVLFFFFLDGHFTLFIDACQYFLLLSVYSKLFSRFYLMLNDAEMPKKKKKKKKKKKRTEQNIKY